MKYLSIVIAYLILVGGNSSAQEKKEDIIYPNYYSTITIGAIEGFSFSIGKYITKNFTTAVKFSMYGVEGGQLSTHAGIGVGFNYYFNKIVIFNYLSSDYIKIFEKNYKGYAMELTAGYNANTEKGFSFVYELGIGYSNVLSHSLRRKILFGPMIKIGLNYNF